MRLRAIGLAAMALVVVIARHGEGQARDTVARAYHVRGIYQDTEMQPWRASLLVRDSTLDGAKATMVRHRSRLVADMWRFDYVTVWSDAGMRARLAGDGGAGKSLCELSYSGGVVEGITHQGPLSPKPSQGVVIPDFALAGYLSTLTLRAGDTVRVSVVRCLPQFGAAGISLTPFVAAVRPGAHVETTGGVAVPTWELTGGADYPAEVVLRRSDAVVLRVKTPQGVDAYSLESLIP